MNNRIFFLAFSVAMLIACGRGTPKNEGAEPAKAAVDPTMEMTTVLTPEQIRTGNIRLGIAEKRDMHRVLNVNGYIDVPPDRLVTVSFPLGGTIEKIELLPGMTVSKGAALVTLQDPQFIELQQQYLSGSSRLQYLEKDYKRQKELLETQAASEKTFQQAETEYRTQQVNVKALEEKLKLIGIDPQKLTVSNMSSKVSLFAPVTGFISKVNVNRGQYIDPNDVLFEIIDPGDNHLNLSVLENDLGALSVGQEVTCHPNNKPDRSYRARVLLINRSVGNDRSSEVHCHFEGTHPELAPGMFMNAEISVVKKQAIAVPNDAIVRWQNKQYIFSAKSEQEFELIPVETGITDKDFTEIILASLPEKIVVKNAYNILMKMKNSGE